MTADAATRDEVLSAHAARKPSAAVTAAAAVLRALADPTRLAIAARLFREADALCACHVEAHFRLSQPTISHHLRVLREAGLVTAEKRGTWVYYALDRARLDETPGVAALLASLASAHGAPKRSKACCP